MREAIVLSQYGGLEIAEATDRLAKAGHLDVAVAHRLADAVSGRDENMHGIFNRHALDLLADAASDAALKGDAERASRYSESWNESPRIAIDEAQTYNLDRKQHALNLIARLQDTFRM